MNTPNLLGPAMFRQRMLPSAKASSSYMQSHSEQKLPTDELNHEHDIEDDIFGIKVGQGFRAIEFQKDLRKLNDPSYGIPKASWYRLAWEISPRNSALREYFAGKHKSQDADAQPETLQVTREMFQEWEEILAGLKDINLCLQKCTCV
ncbi:hypothetical protein EAF04_002419 [Stromatinia cepivora]|nr:hypothetical protein EAF04_002419 [Stromatinia cepivora]